jgi:hypothetical protein
MKRTIESNLDIVDEIDRLSNLAATVAVAITGLGDCNCDRARTGLIGIAWEMQEDLKKVSDAMQRDDKIAMRRISEDRRNDKIEAERNR